MNEGENTYRLYSRDQAGNKSDELSFTILLDRAPPVLESSEPADDAFVKDSPTTVVLVFDEGTSELDEAQTLDNASLVNSGGFEINGVWTLEQPNRVVFTPGSFLSEDIYTVSVQCHDLAGNTALASIRFTYDNTSPEPPVLDPVSSPTSFSVQTLTGTKDGDSAIWLNDAQVVPVDGQTAWSCQITLVEGANELEIHARDLAGNRSGSVFAVIDYDETAPLPVNTLSVDGDGNGAQASLDWNGYDEAIQGDIDYYRVYVQDSLFTQVAALSPEQTVSAGSFACTVSGLSKGQTYYFAVVAVDTKGNALASVTPVSAVPADVVAPEDVTNLAVQCGETDLVFTWTASADTQGDLAGYKVYFDDDTAGTALGPEETSFTAADLAQSSQHPFKITALDADGNESQGVSISGATLLANPSGITIEPYSGYVEISWNGVAPADLVKHYAVYVSDADFSNVQGMVSKATATGTSAKVAGLVNNRQYYFAVTTVNVSGGERTEVATVSAAPIPDAVGPAMTNATLNGGALHNGAVVTDFSTLGLTAVDPSGIGRVEMHVDGVLSGTDSNGSTAYGFVLNALFLADGDHSIAFIAYDTRSNTSTLTYTINVALAAPPAPIISQPADGTLINKPSIAVSGQVQSNAEVIVYRNDNPTGVWTAADAQGMFSIDAALDEGENRLQARARNRAGEGPLSQALVVTLDTSIPDSPTHLEATPQANGVIRLTWKKPLDDSIKGYDLYRATTTFENAGQASKINTGLISASSYSDLPASDAQYFYRVRAVDYADNQSALSGIASATADRVAPVAVAVEYIPAGAFDPATGRMGPGLVGATLEVSEALLATPFLSINPEGAIPLTVDLKKQSDLIYDGSFVIESTTPAGTAYAVFSARDLAGNRGYAITSGGTVEIDSQGPDLIDIQLQPESPVRNDEAAPVQVRGVLGLDEEVKSGETPELSYLLSGADRDSIPVENIARVATGAGHAETWQAVFTLPADAGLAEAETLEFVYSAMDDLDNTSDRILASNAFQVYQGDLPPLEVPSGLQGRSLPEGRVELSCDPVDGAAGYVLYRKAQHENELGLLVNLGAVSEYLDQPSEDGVYSYAVSSVRNENGQEAESGVSATVDVESDATPPDAPSDLALGLVAQGILAEWSAPPLTEPVTYSLYRDDTDEITFVEGLSPVHTGIQDTAAIDPQPSESDHCYAVTAVDRAGNESAPSNSFYLNFELLPVGDLSVVRTDLENPVVSWSHSGSGIAGYDIYLGPEGSALRLNDAMLTDTTFEDTGYDGTQRRYTVVALDQFQQESLGRCILLPLVRADLPEGAGLKRGVMNRLEYVVANSGDTAVDRLKLRVAVEGYEHVSETFEIDPGQSLTVPVVIGGYDDLPDIASLETVVEIVPNAGELVRIEENGEIQVGDGMLSLTFDNEPFVRGTLGQIRFTLENTGDEEIEIVTAESGGAPSEDIALYLSDEEGNVLSAGEYAQTLGEGVVTLANGRTVARIAPGESFGSQAMTVAVPSGAPDDMELTLRIGKVYYRQGYPEEVVMDGLATRRAITLVDTAYYGEIVGIAPENSNGDQDIEIAGRAVERDSGNPLPEVPLKLIVTLDGFERKFDVYTDSDGAFAYTFEPMAGESGLYQVRALHPDLNDRPNQGQFVVNRISLAPALIDLNIPENYEQAIGIKATAGEGTTVNHLRLVYDPSDQPSGTLPQGVHVTMGQPVDTLDSSQSATLNFTIWADNTADEYGKIILKAVSDETGTGDWGTVTINTHFSEATPVLKYSPGHIETGVPLDGETTESVVIENQGFAQLNDMVLSLVDEQGNPAPSWVSLLIPSELGDLAVGESSNVDFRFAPAASQADEGTYLLYLKVTSSNHAERNIPLFVSVTQSGQGGMLFKVADIYTGTVDSESGEVVQGLANARIKVQNEEVLTVEATLATDSLGEALFEDLPSGRYKCRITADDHKEHIGSFWIKPGITGIQEVFLENTLVTVNWEVTETTIEDNYEVVLLANYETNVPAAVLVAEPTSISLPDMNSGDVYYGEFTLTNYGLIRADKVEYQLPEDDFNFKYELLKGLPDSIQPKERVIVPYKVTCLRAPDQKEDAGNGGGCEWLFRCVRVYYVYVCTNGAIFDGGLVVYCLITDNGQCDGDIGTFGPNKNSYIGVTEPNNDVVWSPDLDSIEGVICFPAVIWREVSEYDVLDWLKNTLYDVGCSVNVWTREYNDEATDLSIKVLGGSIDVGRRFYGNKWHWDHIRHQLKFEAASLEEAPSITKDKVKYIAAAGAQGVKAFVYETYKITRNESIYRWSDKFGDWITFDAEGHIIALGNRKGLIAKYIYDETEENRVVGIADRNDETVVWFEHNADGEIEEAHDYAGRTVSYKYAEGKLTTVIDTLGKETFYEYDQEGRMARSIDAAGRPTISTYDQYGNIASVVDRYGVGHFFGFYYDEPMQEYYAQIKTTSGQVKEVWYNADGEETRIDINGRTVRKNTKDGRAWIVTDEKGNTMRKVYDEWDNLSQITYPDGSEMSFEYDHRFSRTTRIVDQKGVITKNEYDGTGNLILKIEAFGTDDERRTAYTYDEGGQLTLATIEADAETAATSVSFSYDQKGNIASITDPEGNTTSFLDYDSMGNLLRMQDPRGHIWLFAYDKLGRMVSQIDPLNNETAYEYDGANNMTAIVNACLKRFEFEYDDHNNFIKATDPYAKYTRNEYNSDDLLVGTIDQEGISSNNMYDNEGRLYRQIDGVGNEISYYYDATEASCATSNKPVRIDYPTFTRQLYYDSMQRIIREMDVLDEKTSYSRSFSFDERGNVVSRTDEQDHTIYYEYDLLDRLVKITDANGGVIEHNFDDRGNLVAVKGPNNGITAYSYDRNDRLIMVVRPLCEETHYEYDSGGNRTAVVDANGQRTEYDYNELNLIVQTRYYSANDHSNPVKQVSFTYDKLGNLTGYEDGITSAVYTYDDLNRKVRESVDYGQFDLVYEYSYYANGLKKSYTDPSGNTYAYFYDDNNRLSRIEIPGKGPFTCNAYQWNSPCRLTLPGSSTILNGYDRLMQIDTISVSDPGQNIILGYDYQYSPTGNIVVKATQHGNNSYEYDELNRLIHSDNSIVADENYTYDLASNRLTAEGVDGAWRYNINNQLVGYGNISFDYDGNGNLISKEDGIHAVHYMYDVENRLLQIREAPTTTVAKYYYDPFGRRLWKEIGGTRTCYFYADEGLAGEYNASGEEIQTYGYLPDSIWSTAPLFQRIDDGYYWYINDHLGTPQKVIDSSGRTVWSAEYDSFGNVQIATSQLENNLRLPGQYYDSESGLYYNWRRYYDPNIGRYLSADPLNMDFYMYAYANSNPINYMDPTGLCGVKGAWEAAVINADSMAESLFGLDIVSDEFSINALNSGNLDKALKLARALQEASGNILKLGSAFIAPGTGTAAQWAMVNLAPIVSDAVVAGSDGYFSGGGSRQAIENAMTSVVADGISKAMSSIGGAAYGSPSYKSMSSVDKLALKSTATFLDVVGKWSRYQIKKDAIKGRPSTDGGKNGDSAFSIGSDAWEVVWKNWVQN